jgi:hypothetical protein
MRLFFQIKSVSKKIKNIQNYSEKIKMATKLQNDANRENAKKSTGPKTKEGKSESSKNATTHGLTASYDVICTESQADFDKHHDEMFEDFNPIGPMQKRLADRIVSLSWRLKRAEQLHNQIIDAELEYKGTDHELALGRIAVSDFANCRVLDKFIMYERRIENSLYKTMKELKNLQKEKMKNEPNFESKRSSAEGGPIHSSTHSPIHQNMQNEPNYKSITHIPTTPNGPRATGHESRTKMQNEPNLKEQTNITPDISKRYEHPLPSGLLERTINKPRPGADSAF